MFISHYESRTGKEKVIVIDEKGRPRKRCAFKDSVSYAPGLTTVSVRKQPKETTWLIDGPAPPFPHYGFTWFYKKPPSSPLYGPRGLCTVPVPIGFHKRILTSVVRG